MTDTLELGDAYGATLDRIKGQGGEKAGLGIAALMWISHSERPLKADELCHALAVEIGSPSLDAENVPSIGLLLACCQGLITVDKEASTVRLIHFTVQEYLQAHPELFDSAHSTMAETCLSYLNSRQVKALPAGPNPDLEDSNLQDTWRADSGHDYSDLEDSQMQSTPFLEYSSLYWGIHAKIELSDCARLLALKLFDDYNDHISTTILLGELEVYGYGIDFDYLSLFTGLHCASLFGIAKIVAGLVEVEGCDINWEDCVGNTPLVWAAGNGHEEVVKILLGRGDINPNKPDKFGRTPLWRATRNGHERVVQALLRRDEVNPDKPDTFGGTPLACAASNGHEGVVKILLGRDDVDPNKPNDHSETPLWGAALYGQEAVVKILLARDDVNPDEPDDDDRTPLSYAAVNGYEGVVKILLQRDDVNPNKPDIFGRTPLWYASKRGHVGVMALLQFLVSATPCTA